MATPSRHESSSNQKESSQTSRCHNLHLAVTLIPCEVGKKLCGEKYLRNQGLSGLSHLPKTSGADHFLFVPAYLEGPRIGRVGNRVVLGMMGGTCSGY